MSARTKHPCAGSRRDAGSAVPRLAATLAACSSATAWAADGGTPSWLPWIVIGAIVVLVLGIVARMVLAARFPKGYRAWAAQRRESFAARNEVFDRADEEFRK